MRLQFSDCVLDLERVELVRAGSPVEIEPQVFEVLAYLIRNQDRVVGADELFEVVWQGRIVSLSTLTSRISAARAAIGDTGSEQKLIRTIPRRGYRFVGAAVIDDAGLGTCRHVQPLHQEVQFCRAVTASAWPVHGSAPGPRS